MEKRIGLLTLFVLALSMIVGSPGVCKTSAPPLLREAQRKVTVEFDRLDAGLRQAAPELGRTGLTGSEARKVLARLCKNFDYAVDCAAVDMQGTMITIEPAPYIQFEGKNISSQEQVNRVLSTGRPALSGVFRAVEGFPAADAEYPVVTPEGKQIGSVSMLFHPEILLGNVLVPMLAGTPLEIWVMERGGLLLYDNDAFQIGLNLFTSQLYKPYPGLIHLAKQIAARPQGSGVYRYRTDVSPAVVAKKAFWQSVSLYGTEWRLVSIQVQRDVSTGGKGILVSGITPEKKLESFAASNSLIMALAAGDQKRTMRLMEEFYKDAPGIYSVQWADEKGINRFGCPRENSLLDYDYHALRTVADQSILNILAAKKPAVFEKPLMEGRTGMFLFHPVFYGTRYLGMVYTIKLKR